MISLSYTSEEDDRVKNLDVISDVEFQGRHWSYQLTITDAESEGQPDGGIGMQVFWNRDPVEGIALLKPYNIDRKKNADAPQTTCSIEYSENGMEEYEAYMIVQITGLPLPNAALDPYALESMKMFVGKKGNIVDVIGNSNHPNALFNFYDTETRGFNWAFVASGNQDEDLAAFHRQWEEVCHIHPRRQPLVEISYRGETGTHRLVHGECLGQTRRLRRRVCQKGPIGPDRRPLADRPLETTPRAKLTIAQR